MNAVYNLKPMVAARLLAEVTALVLLIGVPLFFIVHGDFMRMSAVTRVICILVPIVSAVVLPAYGFVTYRAAVSDEGLSTFSLFRKQFAPWSQIKTVQLKTSWGWRRYVVATADGELNFPIWLNNVLDLCETIRARLPNRGSVGGGGGRAAPRTFAMAPTAVAFVFVKAAAQVAFLLLFWAFFANLSGSAHGKSADRSDQTVVLIACLLLTAFVAARLAFYALCPCAVVTSGEGLEIRGWFYRRQLAWAQLKRLVPALFLLPEGLMIFTERWPVVISDQLDAFDELMDDLSRRLPKTATTPQK